MAVHMNDCVPNISLPCFCISYLIMLVTTRKKITKPQWHNTIAFIAHISGVSRELVGGFVSSDWAHSLGCAPTGCPLVWRAVGICSTCPSCSSRPPWTCPLGDDRITRKSKASWVIDLEVPQEQFSFILLARARQVVKSRDRGRGCFKVKWWRGCRQGEESGPCLQRVCHTSHRVHQQDLLSTLWKVFPHPCRVLYCVTNTASGHHDLFPTAS